MTERASRRFPRRLGVLLAVGLTLSACYEDEDQTLPASTEAATEKTEGDTWLEPGADENPAAFLARLSHEDEAALAPRLEAVAARNREGPRMTANRIGQLWQDMTQAGEQIEMTALLDQFAQTRQVPEKSIGPILQQYRVLRDQGRDHTAAMTALSEPTDD